MSTTAATDPTIWLNAELDRLECLVADVATGDCNPYEAVAVAAVLWSFTDAFAVRWSTGAGTRCRLLRARARRMAGLEEGS